MRTGSRSAPTPSVVSSSTSKAWPTIPAAVPLVEDWLMTNSLAWLGGKPGHAKTFVAIAFGCCVATGTPGTATAPPKAGSSTSSPKVPPVSAAVSTPGHWTTASDPPTSCSSPSPSSSWNRSTSSAFTQVLADLPPALVIIDTQARVTVGAEENSSRDMGRFVETLEGLRRASGACILVVHHEPRVGEHLRGSTRPGGGRHHRPAGHKDGPRRHRGEHQTEGPRGEPDLLFALTPLADSCILSHEAVGILSQLTASENELLTVLWDSFGTGGATKTELKEASDMPKSSYYRTINALVSKGKVVATKEGRSTRYVSAVHNHQLEIPTSPTESQ